MDIDTGDNPPVSSRPYTSALKHHKWVQEEIETLERADVIAKSMSPWASPIVIVPKKSQPGEPPKKRLCICHGLKIRVFYFFYISKTLQMNWISFMASFLNAVL